MYDDLILKLRDAAKMSDALAVLLPHSNGNETAKLYREAADAIESMCEMVATAYCENANIISSYEESKPRWIPVTERLPERNTEVLVYAIGNADGFWGKHVIAIAERFLFRIFPSSEGEEEWSSPWQYFHTDYKITHWRPLPEPPKEEI